MTNWTQLACAFVELAGKSKQDTAPRNYVLSPTQMREPLTAKAGGLTVGKMKAIGQNKTAERNIIASLDGFAGGKVRTGGNVR
jgi:hypothetical protein